MYLFVLLHSTTRAPQSTSQHLDIVTQHKETCTDVSCSFSDQFLAFLGAPLAGQPSEYIDSLHDDDRVEKLKIEIKLTKRLDEVWKWLELGRGPGLTCWGSRDARLKCTWVPRYGLLIRNHLAIIQLQIRNLFSKSRFPVVPLERKIEQAGNLNR